MDKEVIQNALHCCIASYKDSDDSADTYLKEHIKNEKFQNLMEPGQKNTMAMVDTTLYVAFQGNEIYILYGPSMKHGWVTNKSINAKSGWPRIEYQDQMSLPLKIFTFTIIEKRISKMKTVQSRSL